MLGNDNHPNYIAGLFSDIVMRLCGSLLDQGLGAGIASGGEPECA
jgi:hypothetical protein